MDEKDKNIPQPQQPGNESPEITQPVQPTPPTGQPVQPAQPAEQPVQPQPAQPVAQPVQPQPAQPTGQPVQPAQPVAQPAQPQPAPAPQPAQQPIPQPQQPGAGGFTSPQQPPYTPGAGSGIKPKGTAALVCGILSIPVAWFSPLVAVVLAVVAIVLSRKAVKLTGKNGKTTGGFICGIVGIVCAVISFIVAMVLSVGIISGVLDESGSTSSTSSNYAAELSADLTADERACLDLGVARLDQLKSQDPSVVDYIAANLDDSFVESVGISHEDMGSSAEAVALWMLTDFSYASDGVYVDDEEGTATMYADLEMRDSFAFANNFYDLANDFANSDEVESMTSEEAAAQLGKLYNHAMEETTDMTNYYISIEFVKKSDGTWAIDEDAWEDELEFMFNLY